MARSTDDSIYHALPITDEALANGGVEILRAGLIDDELFVTARHAFKDAATWGEVLADITRKLAQIYSLETDLTEAEALAEIEEAYAADLGAKAVPTKSPARKPGVRKAAATPRKAAVKPPKTGKTAGPMKTGAVPAKRTAVRAKVAGPRKPASRPRGKR